MRLYLALTCAAVIVSLGGCAVEVDGQARSEASAPATIDPLSKEARFLKALDAFGFRPNPSDPEQAVAALGTEICRALSNGHGIDSIMPYLREQGYGDQRSGNLIGAALHICPEQQGNLLHGGG